MTHKLKRLKGALLIELIIAAALLGIGLLTVYVSFTQSGRISNRNAQTSVGLTVLSSQIDTDSRKAYNDPEFDATDPNKTTAHIAVSQLPNALITRTLSENSQHTIKTLTYYLAWNGAYGPQTLHASYELTSLGLAND